MNAPDRNSILPDGLKDQLLKLSPDEAAGLSEVWRLARLPDDGFPDPARLAAIWNEIDSRTGGPVPARKDRAPAARRAGVRWFAGVSAALTLAVVGWLVWTQPVSITAPAGAPLRVTLAEGSTIELNSGSTLRYPRRFGDHRTIQLEGEAFFEVAHDGRPFVVETHDASVTVLGTTFNVRAWPADTSPETSVTLETGRVRVERRGAGAGEPAFLEPGETARVEAGQILVERPDADYTRRMLAWREGDFIYADRPLGSILADVERRYAIDLGVATNGLEARRLSVSIRKPASAEAIVRDLCGALGLQYRETRRGFELFEP